MAYVKAQDIFDATQGGLDVIQAWCPDAIDVHTRNRTHFRFDQADTKPACTLREHGGVWWVKNHGEDWPSMHAIGVVMRLENVEFGEACKLIADRFNLTPEDEKKAKPGFEYRAEEPEADQPEGWHYIEYRDPTLAELKTIFSLNVWHTLCRVGSLQDEEKGIKRAIELCKQYNLYAVDWYAWVSRSRKEDNKLVKHVIRSTESYPIFCYDEKEFQKIYQPKARDEKDRFRYFGDKPATYLHGLAFHRKFVEQNQKIKDNAVQEDSEDKAESGGEDFRIPELILCSGGSDALNVAAMGFKVIWKNSETDNFSDKQYKDLRLICRHVYILYDNDSKGREQTHKLAMRFLNMRAIYLPEFKEDMDRDWRGKKYKDVRDYFQKFKGDDFRQLIRNAYPLQFWDEQVKKDRKDEPVIIDGEVIKKYTPLPTLIRNFLYRNGFARLVMGTDESGTKQWEYVRVTGNIVRRISTEEIRQFLHHFLEERCFEWRLRDAFSRSTDLNDQQLALLPELELQFDDFDAHTQYIFFTNKVWKITKDGIEEQDAKTATRYVWANEVIPHKVKKLDAPFAITKDEFSLNRVAVYRKDCLFFRYLINASRVHWRKELEAEMDKFSPSEREFYLEQHPYAIDGPHLEDEEIQAQMQHLANKITAFGYCLHRYKNKADAYAIWSMDYVMDDPDASSGGTGKSMSAGALEHLMPVHKLNGRNAEEISDRFKFEGVSQHTDLVWIDDAHKQTPFDEFFSMITNFMTINRKGVKTMRLDFRDSPKLYIASNFTPTKIDSSTWRRLWFTAYSDYYHYNPKNQYRETRRPIDDFGKQLFEDFTENEWNEFYNFMAHCVQAWMQHGRIDPPMDNLLINTYRQKVGKEFMDWADMYFSEDSGRLNTYWPRYKAFTTYTGDIKNACSPKSFKEKLELWSLYNGYTLNPEGASGYRKDDKRLTIKAIKEVWNRGAGRWEKPQPAASESIEFLYIQTPGVELLAYDDAKEQRTESPNGDGLTF
ncbi:toprim domain-containing protein [Tellurirhabdus bombi]|uniref:toprim domain-containing protein n=1 Tax=Tellurirhabdus bombi TaxID=2907205 RepID=UPI001F3E0CB8|nr:toprim domain-containing protein [Tellurirhabdus bombi]